MMVGMITVIVGLVALNLEQVDCGLYIRWGKSDCSNQLMSENSATTTVYKGVMASSHHAQSGGGKNYLCVADQPEWGNVSPGYQTTAAQLEGVQYAIGRSAGYNNKPFNWNNFGGQDPNHYLAPCVMCETNKKDVFMLPGKLTCPHGWSDEYNGYLVAITTGGLKVQYGTEWICLDANPVPSERRYSVWEGTINVAEFHCGTLPCDKYKGGNEVSCVVCSK